MLDQEIILTLREEYEYAKSRQATEAERVQKIQEEFREAVADHEYWEGRVGALELLLFQDSPTPVDHHDRFQTFGEDA